MTYNITVVETRIIQVNYAIEADTEEEAREKAEIGDTTMEIEQPHTMEVIERTVASIN